MCSCSHWIIICNISIEIDINPPFIDDFPIKALFSRGFSIAT